MRHCEYRTAQPAWRSPPATRQAVNLVDDDDVDLPGADIVQQSLQVGTVSGAAGVSAVIISGTDQGPAGMGLALDVGGGCPCRKPNRADN
jgi:hypothetical protein